MHEMGLAESVLDIVRQHVPPHRGGEVREVMVRIGTLSGVLPDSLDFCFDAIVAGTPYASAHLAIERVPVTGHCDVCGTWFTTETPVFACPACSGSRFTLAGGDDLQVVAVELS
jgi:hydrogenase nickel incorporation protein HypA/HybF